MGVSPNTSVLTHVSSAPSARPLREKRFARHVSVDPDQVRRARMPTQGPKGTHRDVSRRQFLYRAGGAAAGLGALALSRPGSRAAGQSLSPYPEWVPASNKPPKRGGTLTRASAWDPPMLDPRMTQSVGLYQSAALTSTRPARIFFPTGQA